jgi:hypothetical protein
MKEESMGKASGGKFCSYHRKTGEDDGEDEEDWG